MKERKSGIFAYKPGASFTNRESHLQNRSLNYKTGALDCKRDSQLAIYLVYLIPFVAFL